MSIADEIKSRIDVLEVVSEYVNLQKAGRNFKALCPFHVEKTASFIVSPERQTWRCFGACSEGGDIFSFIMRKESVEYGEALRVLAQKAGVELRQRDDAVRNDGLYRVNLEACRFFEETLASPEGDRAMHYLTERGVDADSISKFHLGLSSKKFGTLSTHLQGLGFNVEEAIETGLVRRGDDGSLRDFFRGRLMFPIRDRQGRISGFGARVFDETEPKYINTPASRIFDKRSILYGLDVAGPFIREQNEAVVVEGYVDVITTHQYGYKNVVASMGTALTEQQVYRLKPLAKNFVLAMDPDVAGQEATLRSLEASWRVFERRSFGDRHRTQMPLYHSEQTRLRIASLPTGVDPDSIIRRDPEHWKSLIREAIPYRDYVIEMISSRYDISTPQGKAQAAEVLAPIVVGAGTAIEQEHYFRRVADVLNVSHDALEASIGKPRSSVSANYQNPTYKVTPQVSSISPLLENRDSFLEDYVLSLLLYMPELGGCVDNLTPELFHETDNKEVFTSWLCSSTMEDIRASLDGALHGHLEYLKRIAPETSDKLESGVALSQSVRRLEQLHLQDLA
mgnify:CR=1 FL=1